MFKVSRILGISFMITLYCLVTVKFYSYSSNSYLTFPSNVEKGSFYSEVSTNLFGHTLPSDRLDNGINKTAEPSFKNIFNQFSAITSTTEKLFVHQFIQYQACSICFLIRFRKSDIIFPFHYFW